MATIKLPGGGSRAVPLTPVVGIPLDQDDLKKIPAQLLFRYSSVKPNLLQRVMDALTLMSVRPPKQPYRCPRCQASDPEVTIPVINACSRGSAATVEVECVNGHWARYRCPAP